MAELTNTTLVTKINQDDFAVVLLQEGKFQQCQMDILVFLKQHLISCWVLNYSAWFCVSDYFDFVL